MANDSLIVRICTAATSAAVFSVSTLLAQSAHPFAAPTSNPVFSLSPVAGMVDVNRDGSRDVIVPGLFIGSLVSTFDEDGRSLNTNVQGPNMSVPPGVATLPSILAMVGDEFDGDRLQDLVSITNNGTMHFHRNLGATQIDETNWTPDVIFDNVRVAYPANPPFVVYSFPVAKAFDFDGDGNQYVLVAGGPIDRWAGLTKPGFVCIYKGDGLGGFQPLRYGLPGAVIDAEIADLDNDGVEETVVVLMETGSVGVFNYDLVHLSFSAGGLVPLGQPQTIGPGRLTALEFGDVVGDSNNDYILSQITSSTGSTGAAVYYFEGNGQGIANTSVWGTFNLPSSAFGISDHIASIQVADFNRDGHDDIAMLHGFVKPPTGPNSSGATYYPSELLVAMGPSVTSAAIESVALSGGNVFGNSLLFSLTPLMAQPDQLLCMGFGGDSCADLLVAGLRGGSLFNLPEVATFKNLTAPQHGDARQLKIGDASGAVLSRPARIGFEGGRPEPGNTDFACTIQNVQGGCLVGLMWNPIGIADLFTIHGFTMHLGPQEYGYANLASGNQWDDGFYSYPLPIPNNPALVGDVGCFQYCYYDHVTGAFGGTQATCVWVGN